MNELRGLADGSKTEFYVLFLNMLQEEFSYVVPSHLSFTPATHCSDYIMKTEDNAYIVHNEDGSGMMDFNRTILVDEEVYDRKSFSSSLFPDGRLVSHYTAFTYAAQIPTAGTSVSPRLL